MKTYQSKGFEYFYDRNTRLWTLYPIDEFCNRIEWNEDGDPIECDYYPNRKELNIKLKTR